MAESFYLIVIGSGFGGAISAARLAAKGYRVLVLERGRRWTPETFPRRPNDAWLWDHRNPATCHGWFDFRVFPGMSVVQGAGVGGGSLVYANISVDAKPDTFDRGWPAEITFSELAPYYQAVGAMMNVQKVPVNQWPERTKLMKEAAEKSHYGDRFRQLDLAVSFDPAWTYEQADPHAASHSKPFVNAQGQEQGTCVHLGECDIGCPVKARNTLDLNYIPFAERHHAEVRALHLVRNIVPEGNGKIEILEIDARCETKDPGACEVRVHGIAGGAASGHTAENFRQSVEENLEKNANGRPVSVRFERISKDAPTALAGERRTDFILIASIGTAGQALAAAKEGR